MRRQIYCCCCAENIKLTSAKVSIDDWLNRWLNNMFNHWFNCTIFSFFFFSIKGTKAQSKWITVHHNRNHLHNPVKKYHQCKAHIIHMMLLKCLAQFQLIMFSKVLLLQASIIVRALWKLTLRVRLLRDLNRKEFLRCWLMTNRWRHRLCLLIPKLITVDF